MLWDIYYLTYEKTQDQKNANFVFNFKWESIFQVSESNWPLNEEISLTTPPASDYSEYFLWFKRIHIPLLNNII